MCAVLNMAIFCSSLISCFPGVLLKYCLSDFGMVPVASVISGITFDVTLHMRWIYIMRFLKFKIFSASMLVTFLSPQITTSVNICVPFSLSRILLSCLFLRTVLLGCTCWFIYMINLLSWLVSTNLLHAYTGVRCLTLPLLPCMCYSAVQHTPYHVSLCVVLSPVVGMLIWRVPLSHYYYYYYYWLSTFVGTCVAIINHWIRFWNIL